MDVRLTLKNYRCFSDQLPARFDLRRGFTSFVGNNNAGKSSLLKMFYELRALFVALARPGAIRDALRGTIPFAYPQMVTDPEAIFCRQTSRALSITIEPLGAWPTIPLATELPFTAITISVERDGDRRRAHATYDIPEAARVPSAGFDIAGATDMRLVYAGKEIADLTPLCELFDRMSRTLYIGPFRNAIPGDAVDPYFDIDANQRFVAAWHTFKSGSKRLDNESAYQVQDDIRRLFGFERFEVTPAEGGKTLQVFIDGRSYRLDEVGAGLAQFIIVFVNAAVRAPAYLLIDEPELHLHPALQMDFLTSLGRYAKEGVLFATHNIGLARAAADRIYTCRRDVAAGRATEVTRLESTVRLSEFLGELSYSGYRELGFTKVLLVEGPSEVKTCQQFLRMHKQEHEVVTLPLGGSAMINGSREAELREVLRITADVVALIDSERTTPEAPLEPARQQFVDACRHVGIPCYVLQRRAMEHYFPQTAIDRVFGTGRRALSPYEPRGPAQGWRKMENWRIANAMTRDELDATDLGEFFQWVCTR